MVACAIALQLNEAFTGDTAAKRLFNVGAHTNVRAEWVDGCTVQGVWVDGKLKRLADWSSGSGSRETITREERRNASRLSRSMQMSDLRVDRNNPDTWYGLMETGVAITRDAGATWTVSQKGLDIPRVGAIWTPRHSDQLVVGTLAGMYVSRNRGESFEDTPLILSGGGTIRSELGGIGYLCFLFGRFYLPFLQCLKSPVCQPNPQCEYAQVSDAY